MLYILNAVSQTETTFFEELPRLFSIVGTMIHRKPLADTENKIEPRLTFPSLNGPFPYPLGLCHDLSWVFGDILSLALFFFPYQEHSFFSNFFKNGRGSP